MLEPISEIAVKISPAFLLLFVLLVLVHLVHLAHVSIVMWAATLPPTTAHFTKQRLIAFFHDCRTPTAGATIHRALVLHVRNVAIPRPKP